MNLHPQVLQFALQSVARGMPPLPLPLLVYRQIFPDRSPEDLASTVEKHIAKLRWDPAWRWGVYDFLHFHSTAHELLVVFRGSASLRFGGGEDVNLQATAGDAVVIPAGGGHHNLGSTSDFQVVGAYPRGQKADLVKATPPEVVAAQKRALSVPLPEADPFFGKDGPLLNVWPPTLSNQPAEHSKHRSPS